MTFTPSPELYPFESRWFDAGAGRVHYLDEGGGRPILMCHGNPTWSFLYRHLIRALRDRFRCVAVDYPGFGLSERPAGYGYTAAEHAAVVGELVSALDLRDAIVMGHDWGGPICLSVGCAEPDRVSGVVLGNTWFWPADRRGRVFSRVMSSRPLQRAVLRRNLFVERLLPSGIVRTLEPGGVSGEVHAAPPAGHVRGRRGGGAAARQALLPGGRLGRGGGRDRAALRLSAATVLPSVGGNRLPTGFLSRALSGDLGSVESPESS